LAVAVSVTACEQLVMRWRNLADETPDGSPVKFDVPVARVAVSPDGNYMAVAFVNGAISVYHTTLPSRPMLLQSAGPAVNGLAFDPASTKLAAVRADRSLSIYPFGAAGIRENAERLIAARQPTDEDCERVFGSTTQCEAVGTLRLLLRRIMRAFRNG
jgi:hypothetical protein